jgi:hypothetical protein
MSTAPPPPTQQQPYYGGQGNMPPVPIPNPELIVYVLAVIVVGLVTLVDDKTLSASSWVSFAGIATAAYLISRGLAKMRNVNE